MASFQMELSQMQRGRELAYKAQLRPGAPVGMMCKAGSAGLHKAERGFAL